MTRQYFGWFQYRGLHYSGITMIFGKEAPRNLNKTTSTNQKASWKNIRLPWKNTFQSVCDLLWKLHELHPDRPITLVLDNARYQKCKLLSEQSERLGLDLLYLPPYSPNLNIIERLCSSSRKIACIRSITLILKHSNRQYRPVCHTRGISIKSSWIHC